MEKPSDLPEKLDPKPLAGDLAGRERRKRERGERREKGEGR